MAANLSVGDRVRLARPLTYEGRPAGSAGVEDVRDGIGSTGTIAELYLERQRGSYIAVDWDSGQQLLLDAECLEPERWDLPPSLDRKDVETWLESSARSDE